MEREYITKIDCQFKLGLPEVVRCKDCKHYHNGLCWNVMRRHGLEDDFFCADGERKGGDGE